MFRVWAPRARTVDVELCGPPRRLVAMERGSDDVFEARVTEARAGEDYCFVIDGTTRRADPTSRHQPAGVHGPSRVLDPGAFPWTDAGHRGRPLAEYVLYELHIGTFTPEGTFDAAIARLADLAALGVTAVEVMPVAELPGGRNWGYDGAHLWAPQSTYGGPAAFARFVDACHAHGLEVVLDVVFNHLGPEGCVLEAYAPVLTSRHRTPWGAALDFDGPGSAGVRRFVVDNAVHWVRHYHVDALRLDAVDRIHDDSPLHVLAELGQAVAKEAVRLGRRVHVIAESEPDDVRILTPRAAGGFGLDGQWADAFHHALHTLLLPDRRGPLAPFGRVADLAAAIRGADDDRTGAFVVFVQNHDQIANTARGKRHAALLPPAQQRLAACLLLTAPSVPLLFMGQEYGETRPFDYFVSHGDPALVRAVREGRRREHEPLEGAPVPDPQSEDTFLACKLDWRERDRSPHRELLALHRELLALRRAVPALSNGRRDLTKVWPSEADRTLVIARGDPAGGRALVLANLSDRPSLVRLPPGRPELRLALRSDDPAFGGAPDRPRPPELLPAQHAAVRRDAWTVAVYVGA